MFNKEPIDWEIVMENISDYEQFAKDYIYN